MIVLLYEEDSIRKTLLTNNPQPPTNNQIQPPPHKSSGQKNAPDRSSTILSGVKRRCVFVDDTKVINKSIWYLVVGCGLIMLG